MQKSLVSYAKLGIFTNVFLFIMKHSFLSCRKRPGAFIQLLSTFSINDAIGNAAMEISKNLTRKGVTNYIVYEKKRTDIPNGIPVRYFRFNKNDYVMYHMLLDVMLQKYLKKYTLKKE